MDKISILGVAFNRGSKKDILEYFWKKLNSSAEPFYIVTPNPEMLVKAHEDDRFADVLNHAYISLADGVGIVRAADILGITGISRITGVDFMDYLCKESVEKTITVGFLGAKKSVAERASKCLIEKYSGLNVVFVDSEWSERGFAKAREITGRKEVAKQIDILFVAFGFPKQEFWIFDNLGKIPVRSMMGVGGAFDYISGDVKRAPEFIRNIGLEWLYRLVKEPWRFKRQLALPKFVLLVLKDKLR